MRSGWLKRTNVYLVLIGLFLAGCAAPGNGAPGDVHISPTAGSRDRWQITYRLSGGIQGLNQRLEVDSSGLLSFFTYNNEATQHRLSPDRVRELSRLLEEALARDAPVDGEPSIPEPCADCFQYEVEILREDTRVKVRENDLTLPESAFRELIQELEEVRQGVAADSAP